MLLVLLVVLVMGWFTGLYGPIPKPVRGRGLPSGHDSPSATAVVLLMVMQRRAERRQHPNGERTLMSLEFTSAKKRWDKLTFTLDGEQYDFTPSKSGGLAAAMLTGDQEAMIAETFDWLSRGLPDDQTQRIIDKLRDPEDDFDMADLGDLIRGLQEEVTGRPTGSPNGSVPSPTATGPGSTAGRQRKTSTR
jgi:hypothetical protein